MGHMCCCPRTVRRKRTAQCVNKAAFTTNHSSSTQVAQVQYLSEDGRRNVKRGAERGAAEKGKEGRGKERDEHLRIPLLQSKTRKEEEGEEGKKGGQAC
jgi:hypothetical protein